jgi:uncharacterized protein
MTERTAHEHFDVAIVGAGPAGLIAAAVLAANSNRKILLIDKGREIDERDRNSRGSRAWVEGIGGAGLYSDGKLCMSLDVGGHLRDELPEAEKKRLLKILAAIFARVLERVPDSIALESSERPASSSAGDATFTSYPVLHIGTDRGSEVIRAIVQGVRRLGVQVRSNVELLDLIRNKSKWSLKVATELGINLLDADSVILALGKVGAQMQSSLCEVQGASLISVPMDIGVRLECDSSGLDDFFKKARDPKFKLHFSDGTRIKTHCATMQGEIATLRYEGLPLAGGHAYADHRTQRSGFAILWDGARHQDGYHYALKLMRRISGETGGRLMAQRLIDFLQDRISTPEEVAATHPTVEAWASGNIRHFLPTPFAQRMTEFLQILEPTAPNLLHSNAIIVAPAIEWWMRRVQADPLSMRSSSGIYVCGDGSGWSQGIVHAAATGIIAAEDLSHSKISPEKLANAMFGQRLCPQSTSQSGYP